MHYSSALLVANGLEAPLRGAPSRTELGKIWQGAQIHNDPQLSVNFRARFARAAVPWDSTASQTSGANFFRSHSVTVCNRFQNGGFPRWHCIGVIWKASCVEMFKVIQLMGGLSHIDRLGTKMQQMCSSHLVSE